KIYRQAYSQLPAEAHTRFAAENYVTGWAKDKQHFETLVPTETGELVTVRKRMGELFDAAQAQLTPAEMIQRGFYDARGVVNLDPFYKAIVEYHGLSNKPAKPKRGSSMKGGAPDGSSPTESDWAPKRGDNARTSVKKALMELRS